MGAPDRSERQQGAARRQPRFRIGAETIGIGALLAAVGICCISTLAATGLGAMAIGIGAGYLAGLGWLAPLLAIVGLVGLVWFRARRHRVETTTDRPARVG